jgi:hypothetical protein
MNFQLLRFLLVQIRSKTTVVNQMFDSTILDCDLSKYFPDYRMKKDNRKYSDNNRVANSHHCGYHA